MFSLLWNVAFLSYLALFIIACHVSIWYLDQETKQFLFPLRVSVWWSLRYHLGSIAFGALILAIVWTVKLVLLAVIAYVEDLKKKGVENKVLSMVLKCLLCAVGCFERIVKFISELGFAQVAITSHNFCTSCMEAMALVMSNPMKFGLMHSMGSVITFIGKVFTSALSAFIGYILLNRDAVVSAKIRSQVPIIVLFAIVGYAIAAVFYCLYGIAADTIILCFFADKQLAEQGGRPVSAPAPLQEFYEQYKS